MYIPNVGNEGQKLWWHVHHRELFEGMMDSGTYSATKRRNYIRTSKLKEQVALRLYLMKPIRSRKEIDELETIRREAYGKVYQIRLDASDALNRSGLSGDFLRGLKSKLSFACSKAMEQVTRAFSTAIKEIHSAECPNCTWNGRANGDIFDSGWREKAAKLNLK